MLIDRILHRRIGDMIDANPGAWTGRTNHVAWLEGDYASLFFRIGSMRLLLPATGTIKPSMPAGEAMKTLDVSNITVRQEHRGSGVFTALLNFLEEMGRPVYVENVLEQRLAAYLIRRGYMMQFNLVAEGGEWPRSFYHLPEVV